MDIFSELAYRMPQLAAAFVPMLLGIICHEVAHGYAAYKLGDPTAKSLGRLTLNPIPHIDALGSIFFILTALTAPFILGWARPVPVQPRYFKNPRKGMMLVSFAGPLTNFALAFIFMLIYALLLRALLAGHLEASGSMEFLLRACVSGAGINIVLAWFNLMPLPPLDGSHIIGGLLPGGLARKYSNFGRYGMILIIIVLLAGGFFWRILGPLVSNTAYLMAKFAGVPAPFL